MGQPKVDSANVPIGVQWLRQWRFYEQKTIAGGGSVTVTVAGGLTVVLLGTITPTVEELSCFHVHGTIQPKAKGADNQLNRILYKPQISVAGGGWVDHPDYLPQYGFHYHNATDARRSLTWGYDIIWESQAAGNTYRFRLVVQAIDSDIDLSRPTLIVDICKA